jgi:hypothetical protein
MKARGILLLLAAPALMGAKCGESLVKDPGFDVWCGEALCAWKVEEGTIAKVATWHERDYGVDLIGPAVQLTQRGEYGDDRPSCLQFDLLSDLDEMASVVLSVDFGDDGSPEVTQVLPNRRWQGLEYKIAAPSWYRVIRFSIRKRGEGHAALARMRVAADVDCQDPPVSTTGRPGGAACETAAQCVGAVCAKEGPNETTALLPAAAPATFCGGCDADEDCGPSGVCGLGFGAEPHPFRQCAVAGAQRLGERCAGDRECGTGVCCGGVCSECCANRACAGGRSCARAAGTPVWRAWRCAGPAAAGAPCLAGAECASGACEGQGTLSVCAHDGRTCDEAHPCYDFGTLLPNACVPLGMAGGKCR